MDLPTYVVPSRDAKAVADANWWRSFNDKQLTDIVIKAVENNYLIVAADERSRAVAFGVVIAQSRLYPNVNYALGAYRARGFGDRAEVSTYTAASPLAASWMIDFWGRTRRQIEGAEALSQASEEAWRGVILNVSSQVALAYIRYRLAESQIKITQEAYQVTKGYTDTLVASGKASEATLSQWRYTTQLFLADIPTYEAARQNELQNMRQLTADLSLTLPSKAESRYSIRMPQAIRSDALLRRPDVAQAEQELRAANALIGETEAAMLPEFTISASGGIGYNQLKPGPLLNAWSPLWAIGAQVVGPIFNAGASEARIDIANAKTREAAAKYREAILDAFTDAQYALVAYQSAQKRVVELTKGINEMVQSANVIIQTATENNDVASMLLIANRLYAARIQLAVAQAREMEAIVGVYAAIGGGWIDFLADRNRQAYVAKSPQPQ